MLELALREARSLGHNYIGTEHILLGLVRANGGVAAHILLDLEVDSETVRTEVLRVISAPEYEERRAPKSAEASRRCKARTAPPPVAPTPASFAQVLGRALDQATTQADDRPLDDGDLVLALLEQPDGLISSALPEAGIEVGTLRAAIEAARLRGE